MNYFQNAVRSLRRNRAHSLLNIFGLAVGLACAGLIFLWVEDELSFDNNHLKKDRIYLVDVNEVTNTGIITHSSTPGALREVLPSMINGVVNTLRMSDPTTVLFHLDDKSMNAAGIYADASVFDIFTLPFVDGNAKSAFSQINSIVLTERAARKFFGDSKSCMGKTVTMDNKQAYVVAGVLRDMPENSSVQFEWVAPMEAYIEQHTNLKGWGNFALTTYVEMRPGADIAAVNQILADPKYDFTTQRQIGRAHV